MSFQIFRQKHYITICKVLPFLLWPVMGCSQHRQSDPAALDPGDKLLCVENHSNEEDDHHLYSDVVLLNLKNGRKLYLTDDLFIDRRPTLSPDEKTVAFISERRLKESSVRYVGITGEEWAYSVDLRTLAVKEFGNGQDSSWRKRFGRVSFIDWNPGNGRIIFASHRQLYEGTMQGDSIRLLYSEADPEVDISAIRVDKSGHHVAVRAQKPLSMAKDRLVVIDLVEGTSKVIADNAHIELANWTRDGSLYYSAYPKFLRYNPSRSEPSQVDIPDSIS